MLLGAPPIPVSLGDIFATTLYHSYDINLKILQPGAPLSDWREYPDGVIEPNEKGVFAEDTVGTQRWVAQSPPKWIPYSQVTFIRWMRQRFGLDRQEHSL